MATNFIIDVERSTLCNGSSFLMDSISVYGERELKSRKQKQNIHVLNYKAII